MKPLRVMPLLLLACGCGSADTTVEIVVTQPAGVAVARTLLTIYADPTVGCPEVSLGDRSAAELAKIATGEVEITGDDRVDADRLAGNTIVARGYDAGGGFVTAGCAALGGVTPGSRVDIAASATAVVAVDAGAQDRPFGERSIRVSLTDAGGRPLDATVSSLLWGPTGTVEQASAVVMTSNGVATLHIADLATMGPEVLRLRVPWAVRPPPLIPGFALPSPMTVSLGGGALGGRPSCDVRGHAAAPPTLVCLDGATATGHRDLVEIAWQTDHYATTLHTIPAALDNQFALFVHHDGSANEPVYVLSANAAGNGAWYQLGASSSTATTFDDRLQSVVYVPGCGGAAVVAVQTGTAASNVQFFTPSGTSLGAAQAGAVSAGGCVDDVAHAVHQAVVVADANPIHLALLSANPAVRTAVTGAILPGAGFVTDRTGGVVERRFAGARLQASGTVVFDAVLAADTMTLVERGAHPAAAPPAKILGAELDGDADSDLLWQMPAGAQSVYQVALAKRVNGEAMTAITSAATSPTGTEVLAADLNGGGSDEIVLFSATTATIYSGD